jgi:cell wall-associated NlpC family hydrolase
MLVAPMLFVGCVSEKTASIKPEIETRKVATVENNQTVSKVHIRQEYNNVTSTMVDGAILLGEAKDEIVGTPTLALNENSTTLDEQLTTQTLTFDDTWEEFTKEDEILETAKNFLGTKYVWAANGPSAFDCSGFTKYVFKENGINLPRYSGHQANIGQKIKFSELQKGDLVFFDTEKKFRHKVNHVGIYIGNNKFIHASSAKKRVIITSFAKKKFYKKKFLYARRVINSNANVALNTTPKNNSFN